MLINTEVKGVSERKKVNGYGLYPSSNPPLLDKIFGFPKFCYIVQTV